MGEELALSYMQLLRDVQNTYNIGTYSIQDYMAESVIQVSGMVVFKDVLGTATWWPDFQSSASVYTSPGVNLAP